jgi:hypothetical protein
VVRATVEVAARKAIRRWVVGDSCQEVNISLCGQCVAWMVLPGERGAHFLPICQNRSAHRILDSRGVSGALLLVSKSAVVSLSSSNFGVNSSCW